MMSKPGMGGRPGQPGQSSQPMRPGMSGAPPQPGMSGAPPKPGKAIPIGQPSSTPPVTQNQSMPKNEVVNINIEESKRDPHAEIKANEKEVRLGMSQNDENQEEEKSNGIKSTLTFWTNFLTVDNQTPKEGKQVIKPELAKEPENHGNFCFSLCIQITIHQHRCFQS